MSHLWLKESHDATPLRKPDFHQKAKVQNRKLGYDFMFS